jgi:hypothetical protein
MYGLINANIGIVLQFIATDPTTVTEYDWLVQCKSVTTVFNRRFIH